MFHVPDLNPFFTCQLSAMPYSMKEEENQLKNMIRVLILSLEWGSESNPVSWLLWECEDVHEAALLPCGGGRLLEGHLLLHHLPPVPPRPGCQDGPGTGV